VSDASFTELIRRVRAGDDRAAEELVRLYEPHVRRAVRIRMNQPRLRQVVDSMDVCQSVLARFFARAATGQFRLDTPDQLIALLAKMAENRIHDWRRRLATRRRDQRREVSLDRLAGDSVAAVGEQRSTTQAECDPAETLEQLMRRLPAVERRLAQSRLSGDSWAAIAKREGKTADALRMQLRRAANKVLEALEENG
jgi:RNA polymerase sigma-70 factor (ECF subfamily)